jgi:predicted PurR-regulated permease PerM
MQAPPRHRYNGAGKIPVYGYGAQAELMDAPHQPAERNMPASKVPALRALRGPLWILSACALIWMLRLGRDALVPVALAVLFSLVLSGVVEALHRVRIPRGLSALVLLVIVGVGVAAAVDLIWTPAQQWVQSAPRVLRTIDRRIRPAQSLVRRIDDLARRASALASPEGGTSQPAPATAPASGVTTFDLLTSTGWVVGATLAVMALTLLLLAAGPPTLARMTAALSADLHAVHALRIIDAIRLEVGRYYATLALINVLYGAAVAGLMWLLGMPNPILWGVLGGLLNFIPYLGAATTVLILTLVALVSFDSIAQVALVAASYLGLAAVEGHIIEPVFLGRRLDLNPIVVFVALWLGGFIWGVPGVVVALPVLVAVKVAAAHSRRGDMLVRFLSPRGGDTELALAGRRQLERIIGRAGDLHAPGADPPRSSEPGSAAAAESDAADERPAAALRD